MRSLHVVISGKVQGVFFRKSCKEEAERLEIVGWVRNNYGGTVETKVYGSEEKLQKFLLWCQKGPPLARVDHLETDWADEENIFESFEIID